MGDGRFVPAAVMWGECPCRLAEIAGYDPLVDVFDRLEADALPKHVEQMIERQFDDLAQRA